MRTYFHARLLMKSLRRRLRLSLGQAVARAFGPRKSHPRLHAKHISSVLICRINGRLGNAVFLTPLIDRIHALFPAAAIDIAMSFPQAVTLLKSEPGVRRIVLFPHKGAALVWRYLSAVRQLRAVFYDIVIDPIPESTSGRIALSLSRARYRVGYTNESQWAPLTHAVPEHHRRMHQGAVPVYLLCNVVGVPFDEAAVRLRLHLHSTEIECGYAAIRSALQRRKIPAGAACHSFGFFAHGTGIKPLGRSWWIAFWQAFLLLEPAAVPIEFLPTSSATPTVERFARLHVESVRELTAAIACTRAFISADTGPMHLASATPIPTVGLFQASDPILYRPLKDNDLIIDTRSCPPWLAAQKCQALWRLAPTSSHATA